MSGRGERGYRLAVRIFAVAFVLLGIAVLARTLASGGGPLALGVIMGLALIAIGGARFWLTTRVRR